MSFVYTLLALSACAYLALNLFAWLFSDRLIFPSPAPHYTLQTPGIFTIQGDLSICAQWWASTSQSQRTLLFCHGNAEDIGSLEERMKAYAEHGWNVLIFDYPGYGQSPQNASVKNTLRSAEIAYNWLIKDKGIEPHNIIAYGRSLGGGPATHIAAHFNPSGLILECTYCSIFTVVTRIKLLFWDKFENIRFISKVRQPSLFIHGEKDEIVPFYHGKRLHEAASEPKDALWLQNARHNDLIDIAGQAYWDKLETLWHTTQQS